MLRQTIFDEFEVQMRKISKRDVVNDKFHEQTMQIFNERTKNFVKKSAELIIDGSGWGE